MTDTKVYVVDEMGNSKEMLTKLEEAREQREMQKMIDIEKLRATMFDRVRTMAALARQIGAKRVLIDGDRIEIDMEPVTKRRARR